MILDSGPMVRFVLILLLFFSIISWAIIFIKYRYLRKARKESLYFTEFFWKSRDLSEVFAETKRLKCSPIARVFSAGYIELKKSTKRNTRPGGKNVGQDNVPITMQVMTVENVRRSLRRAMDAETTQLNSLLPFLATTGSTTPFIGLFGTVWGIMTSFRGIGLKGSASLAVVAPGISEALIATAAGLAAAIPAVVAFNYFSNKVKVLESEMESFSADFLNIVDRNLMQKRRD
nr:protein TolQ [Desulfobacterales bacterium]